MEREMCLNIYTFSTEHAPSSVFDSIVGVTIIFIYRYTF